jgi:hypothetical protein
MAAIPRLLLIEDHAPFWRVLVDALSAAGHAMRGAFACLQEPFAPAERERLVGAASAAVA